MSQASATWENISGYWASSSGKALSRFVTVSKGRAAYSDLVCLPDGSVGILYENGDPGGKEQLYRRISFETVSPGRLFD